MVAEGNWVAGAGLPCFKSSAIGLGNIPIHTIKITWHAQLLTWSYISNTDICGIIRSSQDGQTPQW